MRFGYLRDPLFLVCVATYFVNKHVLKHIWHSGFVHDNLNDLICIPVWVPIMLWVQFRLGLRAEPVPPRIHEVVIPVILWSLIFEYWLPYTHLFAKVATADPEDAMSYAIGGMFATLFWNWWYRPPPQEAQAKTLR